MIRPGDDLAEIVLQALQQAELQLQNGDILIFAQKIISKAEGRLVNLHSITPSQRALELAASIEKDARLVELILQESNEVLRTRPGTIIVEHRLGFVCANAGIDHSNVAGEGSLREEWVLLLPKNPDASAGELRRRFEDTSKARLGVMIIDSHGRAWRTGTVGVAIGLSGMPGLEDLRGKPDLFGFRLRITQVGAADELAAGASLLMGQAAEATPVIHVRGFPYALREGSFRELVRPKDQDLFR
jgi:coenzyme F420-0:L-glutamate ligase/coenzyme F420-1:gamma-L-glutamate ligase